ncbi:hypothetical protein R6Q57_006315 [Mikania cordata]
MGEKPVNEIMKPSFPDPVIVEFRNQLGKGSGIPIDIEVVKKIKSSDDTGRKVILNFLVVFNNIIGETTKGGMVNMRFLKSVVVGSVVEDFDWCAYIITCLKRTKLKWSGIKHYNGLLCLLVNVVDPINECGSDKEAHDDEKCNLDILASVSRIPTPVIDEFIEGLLKPEPTNSPARLSTWSPFYRGDTRLELHLKSIS